MDMAPQEFVTAVRAAVASRTEQPEVGIRIVVLQRGWVIVGNYTRRGQQCTVTNGYVIRRWGTTSGLGQLASGGPIYGSTVLEDAPEMKFHQLTECFNIACSEDVWSARLRR